MFFAVPLGMIGGTVGWLFMLSIRRLLRLFQPMQRHVVLRGLIGGLGMGLIGALLPLTLFSGEAETAELVNQAAEIGVLMLIVLGFAKLLATSLVLATGWKGGYIFPIMFTSVALGMAVNLLFPGIPVPVTVASTMAGALVAALKAPLFAALFSMVLVQKETARRDRGCCGDQRLANRPAGPALHTPRRRPGRTSPGCSVMQNSQEVTDSQNPNPALQRHHPLHSWARPV